jgi:hypothetical protein
MKIERIETGARMSKVVIHGDTVYLASRAIWQRPAPAGTDQTKLLRATIWLSDIRAVDDMNKVWNAWVPSGLRASPRLHQARANGAADAATAAASGRLRTAAEHPYAQPDQVTAGMGSQAESGAGWRAATTLI